MNFIAAIGLATQLALSGHLHDGLAALEAKKYEVAIVSLTKVIDNQEPDNFFREVALHYRAEAYRGQGDKVKALADWTTLLKTTRNDQLRAPATVAYKELGGDLKNLLPAESPTAVWNQFLAAAQKADVEAALAVCTGMWRELVQKECRGDGTKLQREFTRKVPAVLEEKIGEGERAGKAWLQLQTGNSNDQILLELTLDTTAHAWRISGFREQRGERRAASAGNLNRLKQIGVALHLWADDNGGKFPDKLEALIPNYLNDAQVLAWTHPKTGKSSPFLYCPGLSPNAGAAEALAAAPEAVDGQRDVLFVDGHVERIKEEALLRLAKAQSWAIGGTGPKVELPKEKQEEVRQLVQQLGHQDFAIRNAARQKLHDMGNAIASVLAEFKDVNDPEIRATVRELLAGQ